MVGKALREGILSIYSTRKEVGNQLVQEKDLDELYRELDETLQTECLAALLDYRRSTQVTVSLPASTWISPPLNFFPFVCLATTMALMSASVLNR